ncbi:MAG: biotin--[acetyl-CoA-carboxylase] ligase [Pseudomonadota bacterium]
MSADAIWPKGVGRCVLDETDSTNAEALRRAPGLDAPLWICALHQNKARGRRGRAWVNPEGNFAATLATPLDEPPERLALRSFVASLALYDVLSDLTPQGTPLSLKWPNDVLLGGGKVAGILLETTGAPPVLAIGIGVNLAHAPSSEEVENAAFPPVALASWTGEVVAPLTFLDHLARSYARREAVFSRLGFGPIREAWLTHAARLGQEIMVRMGDREMTGTFDTVDDSGQLVLSTPDTRVAIPAADVYF